MRRLGWLFPIILLLVPYVLAALAPFVSPYSASRQFREFSYAPPARIRFVDEEGRFSVRPFIYAVKREQSAASYHTTSKKLLLEFFVEGEAYEWSGLTFTTHLFGLSESAHQIFLLGSDALGRDLFSRLLFGARYSFAIGLLGLLATVSLGVGFGALAGYSSGWIDSLIMRMCDLLLALPGLFLVLGLRAVFPMELTAGATLWMIVLSFTLMSWGVVTRVIRGQVLSLKERPHVLAARVLGASSARILRRHILPFTYNYVLIQCLFFIPVFVLGEITLSFLGLGVQEPEVSLGLLLADANSLQALTQYPWLLAPVGVVFAVALGFNLIGDAIKTQDTAQNRW